MSKKTDGDDTTNWKLPTLIVVVVVFLWGVSWFILSNDPDRGTFGDMFGGINALFSGLAFSGVIYAIILQKKELTLQRKELRMTRKELKGQKKEMALQNETLLKQNFENTFFQLLRLHGDIVSSIDLVRNEGNKNHPTRITTTGRDCFKVFEARFKKIFYDQRFHQKDGPPLPQVHAHIQGAYNDFFSEDQANLGHYFRSLYQIVKLVDQSEMDDKKTYTNLIRAQLSSYELTLLFYYGLSLLGGEKFLPLIEKYTLLKHLDASLIINDIHMKIYAPSAFE